MFTKSTYAGTTPLRKRHLPTIAPTGTISIICGASSGIEPLFAISFVRNVMDRIPAAGGLIHCHVARRGGGVLFRRADAPFAQEGTHAHSDEVPEHIKRVFVPPRHYAVVPHPHQAAFQRHTDNSVSKTATLLPPLPARMTPRFIGSLNAPQQGRYHLPLRQPQRTGADRSARLRKNRLPPRRRALRLAPAGVPRGHPRKRS